MSVTRLTLLWLVARLDCECSSGHAPSNYCINEISQIAAHINLSQIPNILPLVLCRWFQKNWLFLAGAMDGKLLPF